MRLEELIEIEKRKSRAEGLEEGRAEGRAEALLLVKEWMLETAQGKNCDADFIQRVKNCGSIQELQKLKKMI